MTAPHKDSLGVATASALVMDRARKVVIDDEALSHFCQGFPGARLPVPDWNRDLHFTEGTWRTANYVLVLDALNFCFWPDPGEPRWKIEYRGSEHQGYWALAAALKKAIESGVPLLDASYLAQMRFADVESLFAGQGRIPMLERRHAHLVEVGQRLHESYDGRFSNLVEATAHDAIALVEQVVRDFPCFSDVAHYEGLRVPFYKRAQILAVDLHGTFAGENWGTLSRLDEITAFADYKVPQVLRRLGIIRYDPSLAAAVDAMEPIPAGDPREMEIRAATIVAVERIREVLQTRFGQAPRSFEVDWYLWGIGQTPAPEDRPYHRTRTWAY